ncbi:MAG: SDR family oxidoreductase [Chloroflexi bacterium]|nr:SDR family oxidoreductase [Chloroflexota bacterium]
MEISGSTALVTGASKRIGRGIALALAEKGCNVAVHYHVAEEDAMETRDLARALGVRSEVVGADLSSADECVSLWSRTVELLDDVPSVVINNASYFDRVGIEEMTPGDFDQAMAVNVRAPLLLAQAMARELPEYATGKIININDRRGVYRSRVAYSITNSALTGLTKTLAVSLAPRIQVNELRLGIILPLPDDEPVEPRRHADRTLGPASRMGTVDEVCQAVISIIGNDYINGASLNLDGGLSAIDGS